MNDPSTLTVPEQPDTPRSGKRITGYDFARALAIFGMVIVNFKIVMGAEKAGPHWLLDVFGLLENQRPPVAIGSALAFCVLAVGFAHAWKQRFQHGPLEWVMRRLTG